MAAAASRRRRAAGLACVLGTAVCWVASSFISQALVRPRPDGAPPPLPPFLLVYICTSLFSLYLPIVLGARALRRRRQRCREVAGAAGRDASSGSLASSGGSGSDGGGGLPRIDSRAALLPTASEERDGGGEAPPPPPLTLPVLLKAALQVGPTWFLAQLAFAYSLALTSVTSNTILSSTSCLFAFLASVLFLGEKFTARKAVSVLAVMAGTAAVALADTRNGGVAAEPRDGSSWGPLAGDLLATGAAALYAVYTLQIQRALGPGASTGDTALYFGALGAMTAAGAAPLLALLHFSGAADLSLVQLDSLGLACFNGIMDYVLADFLWARAVLLIGPTPATLGLSVQVPLATGIDAALGRPAWLSGPLPAALTLGGGAAILAGFASITLAGGGTHGGGGGGGGDVGGGGDDEEAASPSAEGPAAAAVAAAPAAAGGEGR
ncbi:hypothetical protein Rsub_03595 [Raphidocelis subcapitata]|uniref:EamA domain-containing protein n=1 Tax=Raphidocelis subcapitata TaxID=307507 RepID=A0A2V0P2G6_9CHLO|nr:hypothetical protein Rsub_03595 [Raphidocelis subcapitata]|eukprot:GBF91275.1 hypothetical protein Rsub_03595 [Raphidocelis subcapitata]